jgi:class 3 adenylate cyclase
MRYPVQHFHWKWHLKSSVAELWPLVSNTNRFDQDSGTPRAANFTFGEENAPHNGRVQVKMSQFGVPLQYLQEPFEWAYPNRFGVVRRFSVGPMAEMRVLCELVPHPEGGTWLHYQVWIRPRNLLGWLAVPIQVGILFRRTFGRSFREYDQIVAENQMPYKTTQKAVDFASGGRKRLEAAQRALLNDGADPALLARLVEAIETGDPVALAFMRPYALADFWQADRQEVLRLCLVATRHGLLDLQWNLLCPSCRGIKESLPTLGGVSNTVHCEVCNIDFTANFEQSVELTFRPNPAIRTVEEGVFCIGGPQDTPHVVVQQLIPAGESRTISPTLEAGRYRLRTLRLPGGQPLEVHPGGPSEITLAATGHGWPPHEQHLAPTPTLHLENQSGEEHLFMLERYAWSDQAAIAAEVTLLQMFRDLFANEALRPGEQISVGKLAILFTDLRGSTRLYREIGDAPAFGLVMDHFDVLREVVIAEKGVVVKTLGDSIMAAFREPVSALRAALRAQKLLGTGDADRQPLKLKAGLHFGPCIAVTLNERLDYFGSTVNIAARLENQSQGDDVIISAEIAADPEIAAWLAAPDNGLTVKRMQAVLKGFDQENFELTSVKLNE